MVCHKIAGHCTCIFCCMALPGADSCREDGSALQFPQCCRQVRTIRETCQELVNHFSLSFSMLVLQFELKFFSFQKCTEVAEMQSELLKRSALQFPQYCRQVRTIRETCQELVNHFSLSFSRLVLQFELNIFLF